MSASSKIIKMGDVVITGISGAFPKSDNVEEFKENLFSGKDLTEENERWASDFKNIPTRTGCMKTLDRFDHSFFRVNRKHAEQMDIASRILLEKTFEAIIDAGYNPEELKGTNTGVFYGSYNNESEGDHKIGDDINEYVVLGKSKSLTANRISYFLDINGPSFTLDTACSSSMYALENAFKSIQNGDCEAAIVCTSNVCLSPYISRSFYVLGILDKVGICQPFDAQAIGFVRAEAVVVMFLQKIKDARRVYANIIHSKTNCDGFKEDGITFPLAKSQKDLYERLYNEAGIDPNSVSYIEAHGTGTKVGDIVEVNAMEEVFCKNRSTPLQIGSVKSNMGHSEACSGLVSVTKLIIAFETGFIPPNIHFNTPNPKISGLHNGNIQVIAKTTPCRGEFFAVNSYGVGGANGHVLLSPHKKEKKSLDFTTNDQLPRLVNISGRTEEAVNVIMNDLEKHSTDVEYIGLMHKIFSHNIGGHIYRGFMIFNKDKTIEHKKHINFFSGEKRPIWFVFSGMGSQWPTMGKSLMAIPIFSESIRKSHEILKEKNLDLIRIITENDPNMFDNILNSFVGIAAIQIALVDVLRAIDINPDGIIGHSVGELGCAYADGCFTAEQMILAAYYRGLVSLESGLIHGTMAAVGASYDVTKNLIPPEIDIACHNGPNSCTISGPTNIIQDFMKELHAKKIYVRAVNTSNIAYHSRYIRSAGSKLISYLTKVIPDPKQRSEKWICTSALEHEWSTEKAKYSSAEYHTNNLLNPVYFEESSRCIPENAVTIEIAPHGLMQSILKRSLPSTVDNIPLTMKDHDNGVGFLLSALGQLYEIGCNPKISNLYPPIQFPVSRSTPMISPLIKWQHDEEWPVTKYAKKATTISGERDVIIEKEDFGYLRDHIIDGRNLYPALGYLGFVWETIALMQDANFNDLSVVFENVRFEKATNIPEQGYLAFHVSIHRATGHFEVSESNAVVVTGTVRVPDDIEKEKINVSAFNNETEIAESDALPMTKKDFYKELRLRGYHYKGLFKNLVYCNTDGTLGKSLWCDNFVAFMDTMAQMAILNVDTRELIIPTFIRKIVIDVRKHFEILNTLDKESPEFPIRYYPELALTCSGGIQLIDWKCSSIARRKDQADPVLEKYQFVPYISEKQMDLSTAVRICVHIALENLLTTKVRTVELLNPPYSADVPLISTSVENTLRDLPMIQASVNVLVNSESEIENRSGITISNGELPNDKSCAIVILSDIRKKTDIFAKIFNALKDGGFIIAQESIIEDSQFSDLGLDVFFSRFINANKKLLLLRKLSQDMSSATPIKIKNTYSWIPEAQKILSSIKVSNEKLVVYAEKDPLSGISGFFNCLRKEEYGEKSRCFFLVDEDAPEFSLENPFYKAQFVKDLSHNVFKNGQWGSFRNLPLETVNDIGAIHAYNTLDVRGDLSSFRWVEGPLSIDTYTPERPLIHVYYSALNFRDVMITSGKISSIDAANYNRLLETYHGMEFSGKDSNGNRYVGIKLRCKGIASLVQGEPNLLWRVPDHMTLEEASTIFIAYSTVIFGFVVNKSLRKGSSVLIHAATGAVGQAAIHICLHYQCNIFVTVGTPEKREFIKKTFPQIPEENIANSRDSSFEELVMRRTKGKGVDVVLNSLSEDKLRASVRCLAKYGHFVEIGKYDLIKNNPLEMGAFLKAISFHSIQLDDLANVPTEVQQTYRKTVQDMLDNGIIKPINRTIFGVDEVETAIRYMAAGKHIGKVIIKIRDEETDKLAKPIPIRLNARPQVLCQEDSSYVIVGGLGGFGLELCDWLIIRGARNIVLSSRNGLKNGYQSYRIKLWKSYGVKVVICTEDITTEAGVANLLQTAAFLGPVVGIFNVALILKDNSFEKQTEKAFEITAGPKCIATQHLDKLSRSMCPDLEHFVAFSSIVCGRGNAEQTNYGMANSIMERICEKRRADNLPALAIQWGVIGEVGFVADLAEDNLTFAIGGTLTQKVTSCLQTLNSFMKQPNAIVSSMVVAEKCHADTDIINVIANILGIKDLKTISLTWTLPELGMDSVMAVEMKQIVESEFDVFLTPQDLKTMTFAKLYHMKEEKEKTSKSDGKKQTQYQMIMDEKFLNLPIVRIPFIGDELNEEISVRDNPTVFVFPGVEGMAKIMEPLAKNLNLQVLCFQYMAELTDNTLSSQSEYYFQLITDRLAPDQECYIIAHSLGTTFGMEVARRLEKQGRKGHIWFLDSTPDSIMEFRKRIITKTGLTCDEEAQCIACFHLVKALVPERAYDEFSDHIQNVKGWESKKKFCGSIFPKKLWSKSLVHRFLDKTYALMTGLLAYEAPTELLEMECTLIRCVENLFDLDECYGLSKYFKHSFPVHQVEAGHFSITEKKETADIIMENEIWKKYESRRKLFKRASSFNFL